MTEESAKIGHPHRAPAWCLRSFYPYLAPKNGGLRQEQAPSNPAISRVLHILINWRGKINLPETVNETSFFTHVWHPHAGKSVSLLDTFLGSLAPGPRTTRDVSGLISPDRKSRAYNGPVDGERLPGALCSAHRNCGRFAKGGRLGFLPKTFGILTISCSSEGA